MSIYIYISGPENSCDIITENHISTGRPELVILARYPKFSISEPNHKIWGIHIFDIES
jgi:hypothetical protein